jgi:hypothetical protein
MQLRAFVLCHQFCAIFSHCIAVVHNLQTLGPLLWSQQRVTIFSYFLKLLNTRAFPRPFSQTIIRFELTFYLYRLKINIADFLNAFGQLTAKKTGSRLD